MTSQFKTALLLGLLTALVLFIGQAMGGRSGLYVAFAFALIMNVGSYWFSDRIVLAMYRARELAPHDAPGLHDMVGELARNAGIPKPKIYLIPQEAPNAFATGRNPEHGVVAVTQGIMRLLSPEELRGVLAHELGHVKNRDILVQTVAAVLGGVVMMLANMLQWAAIFGGGRSDEEGGSNPLAAIALAILAPIAAMLIQMAISRSREFLADATGAKISGQPLALASALGKIEGYAKEIPMRGANPATENMFIISPFSAGTAANWFSTHPPTAERIRRLREMAGR
ncbi:zinc metalloprotease HtpX [Desulfolutivibrio sulfoxidireducens]|uniref:zinc metalloprotease HtpX n=1 Tax=Desulfolutivibrio sulfoxidireducens TaxID=2773299 RepID=UPI00159E303F|nr:zinc metalloprotease HtpX [Desulfolutivibrio sulfoxidireducens]QLA16984.1 zinc metalloprotease HtpX [Desulfolutivibrio sulfoxidireducens]QLA20550.1 zinc metalloprotease HtpX [Desulfolutivibrio sulfoxidireducens]